MWNIIGLVVLFGRYASAAKLVLFCEFGEVSFVEFLVLYCWKCSIISWTLVKLLLSFCSFKLFWVTILTDDGFIFIGEIVGKDVFDSAWTCCCWRLNNEFEKSFNSAAILLICKFWGLWYFEFLFGVDSIFSRMIIGAFLLLHISWGNFEDFLFWVIESLLKICSFDFDFIIVIVLVVGVNSLGILFSFSWSTRTSEMNLKN